MGVVDAIWLVGLVLVVLRAIVLRVTSTHSSESGCRVCGGRNAHIIRIDLEVDDVQHPDLPCARTVRR